MNITGHHLPLLQQFMDSIVSIVISRTDFEKVLANLQIQRPCGVAEKKSIGDINYISPGMGSDVRSRLLLPYFTLLFFCRTSRTPGNTPLFPFPCPLAITPYICHKLMLLSTYVAESLLCRLRVRGVSIFVKGRDESRPDPLSYYLSTQTQMWTCICAYYCILLEVYILGKYGTIRW